MHHHFSLDGVVHRAWLTQRGDSYALLNEDGASHEAGLYLDAKGEGYLQFEGQNLYVVAAVKGLPAGPTNIDDCAKVDAGRVRGRRVARARTRRVEQAARLGNNGARGGTPFKPLW